MVQYPVYGVALKRSYGIALKKNINHFSFFKLE